VTPYYLLMHRDRGEKRTSGLATRLSAHMLYLGNMLARAFVRLTNGPALLSVIGGPA
jgi:hypothetical protein